mgnify:CR=1 FL=1
MSCNAWMGCTVTVYGHGNDETAREWCEAAQVSKDAGGNMTLSFEWDSAGWFHWAVETLEDDLRSLPLPPEAWSAHVRYEYYDEPSCDGCFCEFDVIDGKTANFRESRIVMVECEPWIEFDMGKE